MADIREAAVASTISAVTITTTTETVVITSPPTDLPAPTITAVILGWCQMTIGTACTAVTPRIRRGTTITAPLVGAANAEAIKTAVGSNEPFFLMLSESLVNLDQVQYSFTVQQTAATGNGNALLSSILVLLM